MTETLPKPKFVVFCEEAESTLLDQFFKPKSVAVIGATRDPKKLGGSVLNNIVEAPFKGALYPINPKATEILGLKAYPSVKDVPGDVDLAVITTPAQYVAGSLIDCGEKGVKAVVVISAGFRETGPEGRKMERELGEIASRYGMRVIGPNVLGVTSSAGPLNATFATCMPLPGNTSFMSQSGALMSAILDWSRGRGLRLLEDGQPGQQAGCRRGGPAGELGQGSRDQRDPGLPGRHRRRPQVHRDGQEGHPEEAGTDHQVRHHRRRLPGHLLPHRHPGRLRPGIHRRVQAGRRDPSHLRPGAV